MSHPSVAVRRLPLVRALDPAADLRAFSALRRLLAVHQPDLVHSHMAKAGSIGRLSATTVSPRPRTVHTFHGHVLEGYFRPEVQRVFIGVERRLARRTDALIAVSPEIRDELLAFGIGRPSQFHVVPLGLHLAPFLGIEGPSGALRSRLGLAPTTPLVGAVGRLVPIKDLFTLLAAMERLPGVHLAVIGNGELRHELEARTQMLGLAARVHFTGWWGDDLAAAVSDLDAVVLTSRNEGTPVALIEASAGARAVVATDVGGVKSVVCHGKTGLLAPVGDAELVASHLAAVLGDAGLRRRLGQAGRRHVAERFGKERLLSDMRDLYSELLGGRRRPAIDLQH